MVHSAIGEIRNGQGNIVPRASEIRVKDTQTYINTLYLNLIFTWISLKHGYFTIFT